MVLTFVYGTLKAGQPNNYILCDPANGTASLLAEATLQDPYPLVIASKYNIPFLLDVQGTGHRVSGDIYQVDDRMLAAMDALEDHPTWYVRREIPAMVTKAHGDIKDSGLAVGATVQVWTYLLPKFRDAMLALKHHQSYDSAGDHGLSYVERPFRKLPEGDSEFETVKGYLIWDVSGIRI